MIRWRTWMGENHAGPFVCLRGSVCKMGIGKQQEMG